MKAKKHPSRERIRELFDYCNSGNLYWKESKQGRKKHVPAGTKRLSGYVAIGLDGSVYSLHRLIYIYHKGPISSEMVIDHISGIPSDNRIENLQAISPRNNHIKRKMAKNNTSGYRGVYWDKRKSKWNARLKVYKKNLHLGYFENILDAARAYDVGSKTAFWRVRPT